MTKPVSTPAGQLPAAASDLAALPPGPGKSAPTRRAAGQREFADVIDQASARKPAHVRGTKSSSSSSARSRTERPEAGAPNRSRDTDSSPRASRVRPNADTTPSAPSRRERLAARATDQAATSNGTAPANSRSATEATDQSSPTGTGETETEAPSTELAATEDTESNPTPTNIIPFPGPGANVIIPFPLAEAQAIPAIVVTATPAAALPPTIAGNSSAIDADAPVSAPAPVVGATSTAPAPSTQDGRAGIDVAQLGLQPAPANEQLDSSVTAPIQSSSTTPPPVSSATPDAPAATIFPVAFNASTAISEAVESGTVIPMPIATEPELPGAVTREEEAARQSRDTPASASSAKIVLLRTDAGKPAPDAARIDVPPAPEPAAGTAGISGARQDDRMESLIASEELAASAAGTGSAGESPARIEFVARGTSPGSREANEFADRTRVATDWQSGRPVSATDRPVPELAAPAASERTDAASSVERISSLVLREAGLVKKHGSDSMAVVLRPDAETELFVHLSRRDGQVEAIVRCERGDAQHLGALWPQLQEVLAQQKVRLAPLEESAAARNEFQSQPGSFTSNGGDRGARQESRPSAQQSMDEWPAPPAAPAATPHVRGGEGTRGRRISTSRPGWETWA